MANLLVSPQIPTPFVIESAPGSTYVILASTQGVAGPAGPAGGGASTQTYQAGVTISQNMVVALQNGVAVIADSSITNMIGNVIGVATGAALSGTIVTTQYAGLITFNGWNWTLGSPIFLGLNGLLTQTNPVSGFNQIIGTPVTTTSMFINLQTPTIVQ